MPLNEKQTFENCMLQEMLAVVEKETKGSEYEALGVSALVIMSHGTKNQLYGTDNCPVQLTDLLSLISSNAFQVMANKPKIVVIRADRRGILA